MEKWSIPFRGKGVRGVGRVVLRRAEKRDHLCNCTRGIDADTIGKRGGWVPFRGGT